MEFVSHQYLELRRKSFFVHETVPKKYQPRKIFPIAERVVRCVWYDQRILPEGLKTVDGEPIEVLSQGEWNLAGGPDFSDALIRIGDNEPVRGAVEIHVRSSDWKRHKHTTDEAYRDVVLNVSLWHDDIESCAYNDLDQPIPHVELCDCLDTDPVELAATLDMESYPFSSDSRVGKCCKAAKGRDAFLLHLLESAGRERMYFKARRMWLELQNSSFGETLYKALMESMGYRPNKKQFRTLAALVPHGALEKVCRDAGQGAAEAVQSLLFGASGLFTNVQINMLDDDTREYCDRLNLYWKENSGLVRGRPMQRSDWRLHGIRPANFPLRRMAGVAELLARLGPGGLEGVFAPFADEVKRVSGEKESRALLDKCAALLEQPARGYWSHRMTPGGTVVDAAPALIGETTAMSMAVNVFIPMLLCRARLDGDEVLRAAAMSLFGHAAALEPHQITRLMRYRMWGDIRGGAGPLKREIIQQGLLQVFFDFCDGYIRDCACCPVPKLVTAGPELPLELELE